MNPCNIRSTDVPTCLLSSASFKLFFIKYEVDNLGIEGIYPSHLYPNTAMLEYTHITNNNKISADHILYINNRIDVHSSGDSLTISKIYIDEDNNHIKLLAVLENANFIMDVSVHDTYQLDLTLLPQERGDSSTCIN